MQHLVKGLVDTHVRLSPGTVPNYKIQRKLTGKGRTKVWTNRFFMLWLGAFWPILHLSQAIGWFPSDALKLYIFGIVVLRCAKIALKLNEEPDYHEQLDCCGMTTFRDLCTAVAGDIQSRTAHC